MSRYQVLIGPDDDIGRWVCARMPNGTAWVDGSGRAIGFTLGDRIVAGVTYYAYNGVNVWTGIASEDPGWVSRTHLAILFAYPFRQLGVQRLSALVDASNTRSRRFVERLGFQHEATLVNAAGDGGDQIVYRMFEGECRWLRFLRCNRERQGWETPSSAGLSCARA